MVYKLYKGYILHEGVGFGDVNVYQSLEAAETFTPYHVGGSEMDAMLWIDGQVESSAEGWASEGQVAKLNQPDIVIPSYPDNIMAKVRQKLGLEEYDTSKDEEINNMSHDEVFRKCLEWEGIIGFEYNIKNWVQVIYGVELT